MFCTKCKEKGIEAKGVYKQTNQILCRECFLDYVETKVFRTISKYKLFRREDKVCIAASGGKDSLVVLYLTAKYCRKKEIPFFALLIDEGIADYRDHTKEDLITFCNEFDIQLHIVSFVEKLGKPLDAIKDEAIQKFGKKPCTVCGIFRRTFLNREARKLGATRLVTGHNLDDESQSFFMNSLLGNMKHNASMGPITGLNDDPKFVNRVKPLYFISEKETRLFCFLKKFKVNFAECPNIGESFRAKVRDHLNAIENDFPGAKNGLVNSFLDVLPELKEKYTKDTEKKAKKLNYCERCGDPCSGKICNACRLEEELCLEAKTS